MFESKNNERGQVGIGTLIVFIAMVLVAAIAAGVLINTGSSLQTQAEATGEESTAQVSDRLEVVSVSGNVTDNGNVDNLSFVMAMAPGSNPIDLNKTSAQLIGANGEETTTLEDDGVPGGDINISNIQGVPDADSDPVEPVLTDSSDRVEVRMDLNQVYDGALEEDDRLTVTFTTDAGATTQQEIRIPSTIIDSDSSVKL